MHKDIFMDARGTFSRLASRGSFATTLRGPGMRVSHFVIVDGIEGETVMIRDVAEATSYRMSWDEFVRCWEGMTVYRLW